MEGVDRGRVLCTLNMGYQEGDKVKQSSQVVVYMATKELEREDRWTTFTVGLTKVNQ